MLRGSSEIGSLRRSGVLIPLLHPLLPGGLEMELRQERSCGYPGVVFNSWVSLFAVLSSADRGSPVFEEV